MIAIFKWSDSKSTKRKSAFVAKVARYIFCIVASKFQGCGRLEFHAVYYILLLTLNNTCYIPCVPFFIERHPKNYKPFYALNDIIDVTYIFICLWQHYILSKRRQYTFLKTERHHIHKQHITNIMTSIRWNRVLQASGGLQCYDIHSSDSCYWQMTFHSILVLLHLLNGYK